jgi:hypothetical protein
MISIVANTWIESLILGPQHIVVARNAEKFVITYQLL